MTEMDGLKLMLAETRQQLAGSQKQIVMLRDALKSISAIEDKLFGPDWEEIDEARDIATEALAATADLDGVILCEKKPYVKAADGYEALYRAWEPKP